MDEERLLATTEDAFLDELGKIKESGILGTGWKAIRGLIGGKRSLGSMWGQTSAAFKRGMGGVSARQSMAGKTLRSGRKVQTGQLARRRAAQAAEAGTEAGKGGGIIGGVREALKTPGGAAAATAAGGLGAGYMLLGRRRQQRY